MNPNPTATDAMQLYTRALRSVTDATAALTASRAASAQSATTTREAEEILLNLLNAIRVQKQRDAQFAVEETVLQTRVTNRIEALESLCKKMARIAGRGERFYVRDAAEAAAAGDLVVRFPNLQCSFWTGDHGVFNELEGHGIQPNLTPN